MYLCLLSIYLVRVIAGLMTVGGGDAGIGFNKKVREMRPEVFIPFIAAHFTYFVFLSEIFREDFDIVSLA